MEEISEEVWQRAVEKLKARKGVSEDVIRKWHRSANLADVLVVQTAIQEAQHEIELEKIATTSRQNRTIIKLTIVIISISLATFFLYLLTALHWP